MPAAFTPIDIEADLNCLRFSARTADLAYHDTEIARFVKRAVAQKLPPAVLELSGRHFPFFFPEILWNAPVWVHWLGNGFDDVIDELAHVRVEPADQYSTDCLKRRQVLRWNTGTHSFCTSPRGLVRSLNSAVDNEVLSLFISPERFACNPTWIGEDLMDDLMVMANYCGSRYRAHDQLSRDELSRALVRSVLLGNEPKTDENGRQIVMLRKHALPQDWYA